MMNKTKLVLAITTATLTMAGLLVAPQAEAHSKTKKHSHHTSTKSYSSTSSAERLASAANNRVEALEQQLQAMQYELQALRSQSNRSVDPDSAKVQELEQWMNSVKAAPVSPKHDNDIFFRGGFARNDELRNGVSIQSTAVPGIAGSTQDQSDQDAWYIGAGFDFGLTDNVWGLMGNTEVLAELMFEYKNFGSAKGNCLAQDPTCLAALVGGAGGAPREVTVNQFTLTAAPKIKFMKGSNIRPWLIPAGLGIHVISPPSESITVLNPGVMFAGGLDYRLWKDIFVGVDARYHLTGGDADGVNTNGFTAGGYLGIGF
ncbi:MAG: porin family protein [Methylovulum sp.]|uniref:porin family protein n=1 Tax=Methylovulum sp. TaxID=1916980 RepID=UPI0026358E41|nr:porin family protein [Methylovulum sp.]MDD2723606.1 porin family protein [Methylovulum sp.]MDD5125493.1 porin family protein [Methylovulum sp.]